MNRERFQAACDMVAQSRVQCGIGTLGEKTLHAVLKHYYEPDCACHEQRVDTFIADILNPSGIIEIQTRGFDRLRKKLDAFLPEMPVTVVYPLPHNKWIYWIDPQTGSLSPRRKSPKTGTVYDACYELAKIRSFLAHPHLRVLIVLLDMDEYRNLDGWGSGGKRGSSRQERIPIAICDEIQLHTSAQYACLLPAQLPSVFRAADYAALSRLKLRYAHNALSILQEVQAIQRVGKQGRAYLYQRLI